jgi:hypothetical protein
MALPLRVSAHASVMALTLLVTLLFIPVTVRASSPKPVNAAGKKTCHTVTTKVHGKK